MTSKYSSSISGGIDLDADLVKITGNVAGRDYVEGISGNQLIQLMDTLLEHFPKHYLKNPDELDKILNTLRQYHEQLREYKDLHHKINDILIAFDPFKTQMKRLKPMENVPMLARLETLWLPVSLRVEDLLDWSQKIKHIGKPYKKLKNKAKQGENWAVQFSQLQDKIKDGLTFPRKSNGTIWLRTLNENTSKFNDLTLTEMDIADAHILHTAQELLYFSNKALSNY